MSTLRTNAIVDASGGTTATVNGYAPSLSNMAGRNRIINGDMTIDQRNAGASVTPAVGVATYITDRWNIYPTQASKLTTQKNQGGVTPPAGFTNYLGVTSSSAYSLVATDLFVLNQPIEGFNVADLGWGTANAQPVTLSFWVRSSLTGQFSGSFMNSAQTRSYPFVFTINAANTWEQKTVTASGDTTGTWLTDNGIGLYVYFSLGTGSNFTATANTWTGSNRFAATGSTSLVGTNGATFYITGVQLEAGSIATPFERRLYGQELALCQRYYEDIVGRFIWSGNATSGVPYFYAVPFAVTKRAVPTITVTNADNSGFPSTASSTAGTTTIAAVRLSRAANATANGSFFADNITASAEL